MSVTAQTQGRKEHGVKGDLSGVREMLATVSVVMVSQAHSYIHADQIIHFMYVHFSGAVGWWGEW